MRQVQRDNSPLIKSLRSSCLQRRVNTGTANAEMQARNQDRARVAEISRVSGAHVVTLTGGSRQTLLIAGGGRGGCSNAYAMEALENVRSMSKQEHVYNSAQITNAVQEGHTQNGGSEHAVMYMYTM